MRNNAFSVPFFFFLFFSPFQLFFFFTIIFLPFYYFSSLLLFFFFTIIFLLYYYFSSLLLFFFFTIIFLPFYYFSLLPELPVFINETALDFYLRSCVNQGCRMVKFKDCSSLMFYRNSPLQFSFRAK